ncbi:cytochrome P450 [Myxococcota bacterium]|nr:cytochrome P450 [Myxococcota bacterium]
MSELVFDPFDPNQTQDMWPLMAEFRRQSPVARMPNGFVYVSRYGDTETVLRDSETFSNAGGMRPTGLEVPLEDCSIGELVPPVHGPIRRLAMVAAQSPSIVEGARPFTRETALSLIDALVEKDGGDLIENFSLALTNAVIGRLLGITPEESAQLAVWGEEIMRSTLTTLNRTERGVGYAGAFPEFTQYLEGLVSERMKDDLHDDGISHIVRAGLDDADLTVPLIRMILLNLVLGGTATTRDFIGSLLLELLHRPELHEQLREDAELIPTATEESLRVAPPVLYLIRTCTRPTELGGVVLEAGERVVVGIASANRDEEFYEDAEQFRLDRVNPAPHFSFGYGRHFCVGAALARMEGQEALRAFLDRLAPGQVRLPAGSGIERMPLPYMLGPLRLDVEIRAR